MNAINSELKEWHKTASSAIRSSRLSLQRMCASGVMALGLCLPSVAQTASNQWEVAGTAGTTGLGFDVGYSVNEHVKVRAGFSVLPQFRIPLPLTFALEEGYEEGIKPEDREHYNEKQDQMLGALGGFVGADIDNQVDLHMVPTISNGKFLVDWYPSHRLGWRVTAGFYVGPSKVGEAYNYESERSFLLALNTYNNIYQNVLNEEPIIQVGDAYVEFSPMVNEKILNLGHASFFIGPKKDGTYYHTTPTEDGYVYANCYTNRFRPYLGVGYDGKIGKTSRCTIGFDAGAMFWGGTSRIITHDGVDLAHDMEEIVKRNLKHLVDGVAAMKVYPVLEFRMAWRVF